MIPYWPASVVALKIASEIAAVLSQSLKRSLRSGTQEATNAFQISGGCVAGPVTYRM
jgi:hypothetical protein